MRRFLILGVVPLLVALAPTSARAADTNVLFGLGKVGPAQYDQGDTKLMATVNATGFFRVTRSLSLLGVGVACRTTNGPGSRLFEHKNFDEFGLAIPFVTYRVGRGVAQAGVEIQRANLQKNFYYFAVGVGFGGRQEQLASKR